jgi:hypothetical protein
MKSTLKTIIIAAVALGFMFGMSSCDKHTCPTYSKTEAKQTEARA